MVGQNQWKTPCIVFSSSAKFQSTNHQPVTEWPCSLSWRSFQKAQIEKNQIRVKLHKAIMKKFSITTFGSDESTLKILYTGLKKNLCLIVALQHKQLQHSSTLRVKQLQNQTMRIIIGAVRTIPIQELDKTACKRSRTSKMYETILSSSSAWQILVNCKSWSCLKT